MEINDESANIDNLQLEWLQETSEPDEFTVVTSKENKGKKKPS